MPHTPTAAQLAQLATLQATVASRLATYQTTQANGKAAKAALAKAQDRLTAYRNFIYGGQQPSGVLDNGNADAA